jgi:hypothetical protein
MANQMMDIRVTAFTKVENEELPFLCNNFRNREDILL